MTVDQRKIQELTDRLNQVTADRDALRARCGHFERFIAELQRLQSNLQHQLTYFDARTGEDEIGKNHGPVSRR